MEAAQRDRRGYGWMETLRQAAAIKTAPEEWVQHPAADHDGGPAGCHVAFPRLDTSCPHRSHLHKRMREMLEQEGGYGGYGPLTSPSGAALPSLLVSRGSFQSLDDAGSPQPSHKVARRLLAQASPSSSGQTPANKVVLQRRRQEQRQLHRQRLQQEPLHRHAEEGAIPPQQGALSLVVSDLLTSQLAQSLSPAGMAQKLESILGLLNTEQFRSEAELRQLRHVQNLIWDIMCMDADGSVPLTSPSATEVVLEASSCSSSNHRTKRPGILPQVEAESQYCSFTRSKNMPSY